MERNTCIYYMYVSLLECRVGYTPIVTVTTPAALGHSSHESFESMAEPRFAPVRLDLAVSYAVPTQGIQAEQSKCKTLWYVLLFARRSHECTTSDIVNSSSSGSSI